MMLNIRNYIMLLALSLTACNKKEVADIAPADAAVNFYNASEVLIASSIYAGKYIFVDKYDTSTTFHPIFYNNIYDEYPMPWGLAESTIKYISYMRLAAGDHSMWFTNAAKFIAADTSLTFAADSYQQLYLADNIPAADSTPVYKIISTSEDRKSAAGKVRIKILHLSPDIGPLHAYLLGADGKQQFSQLPEEVLYGEAAPYAAVDTVNARRERLQLRLFAGTDTANTVVSASLPATPGASYIVVVRGFSTARVVKNPTGNNSDGSIRYERLAIPANIRVELRQSH